MEQFGFVAMILGAVFVPLGLGFAAVAVWQRRSVRGWSWAKGMAVNRHGGTELLLEFRFDPGVRFVWTDHAGRTHRGHSMASNRGLPLPGTVVDVRYDPRHPERARLWTFVGNGGFCWMMAGIFGLFGLVFGISGIVFSVIG